MKNILRKLYWLLRNSFFFFQGKKEKENLKKMIQQERLNEEKISQLLKNGLIEEIPENTFYVIRRDSQVGLFSYVQTVMGHIKYAIENGYIPVVDLKTFPNSYIEDDQVGKVNAWTLFFQPVSDIDLDTILQYDHLYIVSDDSNLKELPCGNGVYSKASYTYWCMIYDEYFQLNLASNEYINEIEKQLFPDGYEKVLGVASRGTDYATAKGHPKQVSVDELIAETRKVFHRGSYRKIFIKTEEHRVVEAFEKAFPNKVISMDVKYYDDLVGLNNIASVGFERENDKYMRGLEYLATIVLLSKCEGLVGGFNGGVYAALYMNNGKYKHCRVIDKGIQTGKC